MERYEEIVATIKKRREFLKLTQQDLAEFSGVALRTINGFESGKASVTLKNLSAIADVLGMDVILTIKRMEDVND